MKSWKHNPKNVHLKKSSQILKTIFPLKITFHNSALKIKTSRGKKSPVWELEMPPMMLFCMFDLFILSGKDLKTFNVKKNNSKCTKFRTKG